MLSGRLIRAAPPFRVHFMRTKIQTGPAAEPVSRTEAKLHLRVEHAADDTYIDGLVIAARVYLEETYGRVFVTQTWDGYLDDFPSGDVIEIPFGQLQSISTFEWTESDGDADSWTVSGTDLLDGSTTKAHIDTVEEPARIILAYGESWPSITLKTANPIHIRFVCGYGNAAAVPQPVKHSILLLVEHWYRNRSAVTLGNTSVDSKPLKLAVDALMAAVHPLRKF